MVVHVDLSDEQGNRLRRSMKATRDVAVLRRSMETKGGRAWLQFLKYRSRFPADQRIYMIQDNLSAHWTPEVRRWARRNQVTLAPMATNASRMNPIECRCTEVESLAFAGSDCGLAAFGKGDTAGGRASERA